MKRLQVLRHAKSDWQAPHRRDHDRPLNRRGRKAAHAVGTAVARSNETPDAVITSSALRARSTVEAAAKAGGWATPIRVTSDLYGTSVADALRIGSTAPDDVERLMIVGHQPTWGSLVYSLTGGSVEIKTATLVAIDIAATSWRDLPKAGGSIAYVLQPRLFTDGTWDLS